MATKGKSTNDATPKRGQTSNRRTVRAAKGKSPSEVALMKGLAHVKKLKATRVKGDEKVPTGTVEALSELTRLATELTKTRSSEMEAASLGRAARVRCSEHNTWWNAFKGMLGICDGWQQCMGYCE